MATKVPTGELHIESVAMSRFTVYIRGLTGLVCHRMAAKAKHQLLLGGKKKTAAERIEIKHNPPIEFLDSMHVTKDAHPHSHVLFPAMAFKSAMATAALAVPGMTKSNAQRLLFFPDEFVPIFGIPRLRMDVVRSADMNRTPDIRTRAYFDKWATTFRVEYAEPQLTQKSVITLLANAGRIIGVGDFRQEKGRGSFGTFEVVSEIPEDLMDAKAQWEAMETPVPANRETEDLLNEFHDEVISRTPING